MNYKYNQLVFLAMLIMHSVLISVVDHALIGLLPLEYWMLINSIS